jgi:arylsulfatase A-like enzyme
MSSPDRQRVVVVMFDSLNRHFLWPFGATWTRTPNFARLARRARTYDRSYVCSMPCMPARRDLHTGRPGFLHRNWGPLEPWDKSVFDELRDVRGTYSHLSTDHYHYFEEGGANYHARYDSWQFFRGQEGDPCTGQVEDAAVPPNCNGKGRMSDWKNRPHFARDEDHYQTKTFADGLKFLEVNRDADNWILQIECFDPHEPFTVDPQWKALFPDPDDTILYDWPEYGDAPKRELVEQARRQYAALLAKCDASLGRVLDAFDKDNLWDDTMLVVCTDHGILLGEHGQMMKNAMPLYEEISHTPLFVHDPRHLDRGGTRTGKLVQPAIDLPATLYGYFGLDRPDTVVGLDLTDDAETREAAVFGYFNAHVNVVTDTHAYYRGGDAETASLCYTNVFSNMRSPTPLERLIDSRQADAPLADSQGVRPLVYPHGSTPSQFQGSLLFDLANDPSQSQPVDDEAVTQHLAGLMRDLMLQYDAPPEQLQRLGLS